MKSHDSHSLGLTLVRSFPSERHESWAAAEESSLRLRAVSPAPHCRACVLQDGVAGLVLRHARVSGVDSHCAAVHPHPHPQPVPNNNLSRAARSSSDWHVERCLA